MVLAFTVSKLWRIWFWRHLNLEIWWWYPNFVHSAMRYYFFLSHWCGFVLYRYTCIHKIPLQCIAYVILGVLILGTVGWSIPANRILDGPRGLILWLLLGAFNRLPWWSCMDIYTLYQHSSTKDMANWYKMCQPVLKIVFMMMIALIG